MTYQIEARVACTHPEHEDTLVQVPVLYFEEQHAMESMQYRRGETLAAELSIDTKNGWPCKGAWLDDVYLQEV